MSRLEKSGAASRCCFLGRSARAQSPYSFAFSDRIGFLDPRLWDGLARDSSLFLSREFLGVVERHGPEGLSSRYAIVFEGSEPTAAVVVQIARVSGREALSRGAGLRRINLGLVVCGNLLSFGPHAVAFAPGASRHEAWTGVHEALSRIARAHQVGRATDLVLLKDFVPSQEEEVRALQGLGYRALETDPNMVLEIPNSWGSFDQYLESLNSKYKKAARGVIREVEKGGYRMVRVEDSGALSERLHSLYLSVQSEARVRPVRLSERFLPSLSIALGDRMRVVALERDGVVDGFATILADGETAIGYTMGFDREANARVPLYLRLLQIVVEQAIGFGCRRLSLGRTALEPKARLGAKPEPMRVLVRHGKPVVNWLLGNLLSAVSHEEAPARSPFRSDAPVPPEVVEAG